MSYQKDHPYLAAISAGRATMRVADLSNPILKPWAIKKMPQANALAPAGKSAFEARTSCRPGGGLGFLVMGRVNPMSIVQTPKGALMINQGGPERRHISLNVAHSAHPKSSSYGESVGHYDNDDTLVSDTIGLSDDTDIDNSRTFYTNEEHRIERCTLANGGNALEVDIRIEDSGAFTMTVVGAPGLLAGGATRIAERAACRGHRFAEQSAS
jgi:hypothetical protein